VRFPTASPGNSETASRFFRNLFPPANRHWTLFSVLYWLVFFIFATDQISGDGFHYFIFFPSLIGGLDLDLSNEFDRYHMGSPWAYFHGVEKSGYATNPFPFGSSLLQFPFFLTAYLCDLCLGCYSKWGFHHFFSTPYVFAQILSSWFYGWLALLLTDRTLRRIFGERGRFVTLSLLVGATPLWNYLLRDASYSHVYSFFTIALFFFLWYGPMNKLSFRSGVLLGSSAGIVFLTRWQDVLFLLPAACELVLALLNRARPPLARKSKRLRFRFALGGLFGSLVWILPQSVYWKIVFDEFWLIPLGSGIFSMTETHFLECLFSRKAGIFSWHPILLLGFAGIVFFSARRRRFRWLVVGLALQWLVTGMLEEWHASNSFGQRRWVSALPYWGIGLGYIYSRKSRVVGALLYPVALLAIAWNYILHSAWYHGVFPQGALELEPLVQRLRFGLSSLLQSSPMQGFLRDEILQASNTGYWGPPFGVLLSVPFLLALSIGVGRVFRRYLPVRCPEENRAVFLFLIPPLLLAISFVSLHLSAHFVYHLDFRPERPSPEFPLQLLRHRIRPGEAFHGEVDSYSVSDQNPLSIPIAAPRALRGMTLVSYVGSASGETIQGEEVARIRLKGSTREKVFTLALGEEIDLLHMDVGTLENRGGSLRFAWGALDAEGRPIYRYRQDYRFPEFEPHTVSIMVPNDEYEVIVDAISFYPADSP